MPEPVRVLFTGEQTPVYAHPGDAGADLTSSEDVLLGPGQRALVGTGTSIALPNGHVAFVVPRSGLAAKHGITIVNTPGTVDAGYRGEIKVILLNTDSTEPYQVRAGDRIAQVIVMPVAPAQFLRVDSLPGSHRGSGGFGSTGLGSSGIESPGPAGEEGLSL
ncbi:dUTP diphosphatase [Naasia lichenicola]|uniref:Deoxyuridine 5'-triphosphate nucleotidohydrolase n=1 Tax=Naasia lichenicola TaxID=2565933 RepID=A0A4V3WTR6_9MICO|nr:dUTP diphosphatase [Naasia lichenicola]THG32977.1 dUTP diphosphatase [Naasia lichenicola]